MKKPDAKLNIKNVDSSTCTTLLKNAQLLNGPYKRPVDILIFNDKIHAVGSSVKQALKSLNSGSKSKNKSFSSENIKDIDLEGRFVTPGLIDAHTHVGLSKSDVGSPGDDTNERSNPITPEIRAIDGVDPSDSAFLDAITGGITTLMIAPGSANPIGGQIVVMSAGGSNKRILLENAGIKMAFGENPKRVHGSSGKMPASRMGTAAVIRKTFFEVQQYIAAEKSRKSSKASSDKKENVSSKLNFQYEALVPLLKGIVPARIHAHEPYDIATAIRIADEFNIRTVIEHSTAAYKLNGSMPLDQQMTLGPLFSTRKKSELRYRCLGSAAELHKQGYKFAITTDHPVTAVETLRMSAAHAIAWGLPEKAALESITCVAADVLGIGNICGRIRKGFRADITVWNSHPFDIRYKPEMVIIAGECVYR